MTGWFEEVCTFADRRVQRSNLFTSPAGMTVAFCKQQFEASL